MSWYTSYIGGQNGEIDYKVGDKIMNSSGKEIGVCTGFTHDNTCILVDGTCRGGKYYFHKSEWAEYEIISNKANESE